MKKTEIESFDVVGITIRASNTNGRTAEDIGGLWEKFMSQGISEKIDNKVGSTIYAIYTDYEGDHTQPYTLLIGHQVSSKSDIPEGMETRSVQEGTYAKFNAKGDLTKETYNKWLEIWEADLPREYSTDYELYDERALNIKDGEIDIFIAVNE